MTFETGWILIKYWSLTHIKVEKGKPVHFTSEILYPYSALQKLPVLPTFKIQLKMD